jgi:hypothetical protein
LIEPGSGLKAQIPTVRQRQWISDMGRHEAAEASFVIEINGRAVLALSALSIEQARALCSQHWFFDELTRHRSAGAPLWDGTGKLTLRAAQPRERLTLHRERSGEIARREFDGIAFAFLIPLDPSLH